MIPVVNPIPKPKHFDENCQAPGADWLKSHPDMDCHAASHLWSPFRPALRKGFAERCGYLAIKLHVGGVVLDVVTVQLLFDDSADHSP